MTDAAVDLSFDDPDLWAKLEAAGPDGYDRTSFGVIALDADLTCTTYNTTESEYAGLDKERVVGRHFFEQVAPCMNNFLVADKFRGEGPVDETMPYTLSVKMAPTPCTLRMLVPADDGSRYLLVNWS